MIEAPSSIYGEEITTVLIKKKERNPWFQVLLPALRATNLAHLLGVTRPVAVVDGMRYRTPCTLYTLVSVRFMTKLSRSVFEHRNYTKEGKLSGTQTILNVLVLLPRKSNNGLNKITRN